MSIIALWCITSLFAKKPISHIVEPKLFNSSLISERGGESIQDTLSNDVLSKDSLSKDSLSKDGLSRDSLFMNEKEEDSQPKDSLVRLISGKSFELIEVNGHNYRKVTGPATFLHNNTYLLCDTALWDVEEDVIKASGNVKIMQQETMLTSDRLDYLISESVGQFRGSIVQLEDKDHNKLRTRYLDFNTKDSTAFFYNGGSMKDANGQIIESNIGTYDSKVKVFTFEEDVNMFTDSIFIETNKLVYESELNVVRFYEGTNVWQKDNMLSSQKGWYDRNKELFLFMDNAHLLSKEQEGWADSLFYYKTSQDVIMNGNSQISDSVRNIASVAGFIEYNNKNSQITLTREPALMMISEVKKSADSTNVKRDTVFFGADRIVYNSKRKCDVDSLVLAISAQRLEDIKVDAVTEYRQKAAKAAAEAAKKAAEENAEYQASQRPKFDKNAKKQKIVESKKESSSESSVENAVNESVDSLSMGADSLSARADSLSAGADSLSMGLDSLSAGVDSLKTDSLEVVEPLDTTKIGFIKATGKVKVFRKDLQVMCDSLEYSDLDSLIRLYENPVVWNEKTRQYSADSIQVLVRKKSIEKAFLMSNAFVAVKEDSLHFDQIKSAEMMAYFDTTGALTRFDALGDAAAIFYLREKEELATVNKVETKMIYALMKENNLDRIYYFDAAKNNAYPIVQLTSVDQELKGLNWRGEERPTSGADITSYKLRPFERGKYNAIERAPYKETEIYFPGYIDGIYRQIAISDSLEVVRKEQQRLLEEAKKLEQERIADSLKLEEKLHADSLAVADSLAKADSLATLDSLAVQDSLATSDSLAVQDSLNVNKVKSKAELRKEKQEARAKRVAARKAAREKRWAEKDRIEAEKKAAKEAKRKARERKILRAELKEAQIRSKKERELLNSYIEIYQKKKAVEDKKAAEKKAVEDKKTAEKTAEKATEKTAEKKAKEESEADIAETEKATSEK